MKTFSMKEHRLQNDYCQKFGPKISRTTWTWTIKCVQYNILYNTRVRRNIKYNVSYTICMGCYFLPNLSGKYVKLTLMRKRVIFSLVLFFINYYKHKHNVIYIYNGLYDVTACWLSHKDSLF